MANKQFNVGINTTSDLTGLNQVKKELQEVRELAKNIDYANGLNPNQINAMVKSANQLESALTSAFNPKLNTVNIEKFNALLAKSGTNISDIQANLSYAGVTGQKAFLSATSSLLQMNSVVKQTNKFMTELATTFTNTVRWSLMSGLINKITGDVQHAYGYVKDLDSSLNDIRIVTSKSADEMERFSVEANKAAKSLAVSTSDYTKGSLIYYQQGLDDETVKSLTDITAKTSNVTGQSMDAVSEELTAVWNGYQVANEAAREGMGVYEEYVDKMAKVGATTASDLEEIATAMSKVSSAASTMGVGFDSLNAQIATIVSVTRQAPESVGTALKTIYARLGDLKIDGEDEDGVKLGEVSGQLDAIGIHILDATGNLRDMGSVVEEVGNKWNTWSEAEQQAIAIAIAGKRQYNNLLSLFSNWDMYQKSLNDSMSATGTLEKQQAIALDSINNRLDVLKATSEELYQNLFDENSIKGLINDGTKLVQLFADITGSIGGLNNILPALGSLGLQVFSSQIAGGIATFITNLDTSIQKTKIQTENLNQLKMMFSNSDFVNMNVEGIPAKALSDSLKDMTEYYGKMQQYRSVMNQQDEAQYRQILSTKEQIGSTTIELEEQVELWKLNSEATKTFGVNINSSGKGFDKLSTKAEKFNKIISNAINQLAASGGEDLQKIVDKLETTLSSSKSGINFEPLRKEFELLKNSGELTEESVGQLLNKLREIGQSTSGIIQLNDKINSLKISANEAATAFERFMQIKQFTANIVNAIGAVGQLATAATMFGNLFSIWNNDNLNDSEKFLQTITNLAFVLPMVTTGFQKLAAVTGISNLIQKSHNLTLAKAAKKEAEVALAAAASGKARKAANQAVATSTLEVKAAQDAYNASLAASPVGIAIMALAALAIGIAAVTAAYEKQQQQLYENRKAEIEESQKKIDQIKANEDLAISYENLINKYKEGKATREEVESSIDSICEAYDLEETAVYKLAERYDDLSDAIKGAREEQLNEAINKANNAVEGQEKNLKTVAKDSKKGREKLSGEYELNLDAEGITKGADSFQSTLEKELNNSGIDYQDRYSTGMASTYTGLQIDTENMSAEELIKLYDTLSKAQTKATEEQKDSTMYQQTFDWIQSMETEVETYKELLDEVDELNAQKDANDLDLSKISSFEDYKKARETLVAQLQQDQEMDEATAEANVTKLMSKYENLTNYISKYDYIKSIQKSFKEHNNSLDIEQWLNDNIYNSPDGIAIAAYLNLDGTETDAILSAELIRAKAEWQEEEANARVSILTSAIETAKKDGSISDEDLQKLKDSYAELNGIAEEGGVEQIRLLQEAKAKEISTLSETTLAKKQATSDLLAEEKKKLAELKKLQEDSTLSVDGHLYYQGQISALQKQIDELTSKDYELTISINDEVTDQIVSLANGVTDYANKMATATDLIGANYKVSAENVKALAAAYPELLINAQVATDGTVQLSKEVVQQTLNDDAKVLEGDAEKTGGIIDNQITILEGQLKTATAQRDIAQKLADGEIGIDEATNEAKTNGLDTFSQFLTDSYNDWMNNSDLTNKTMALQTAQLANSEIADIQRISEAWAQSFLAKETGSYTKLDTGGTSNYQSYINDVSNNVDKNNYNTSEVNAASKAYGEALLKSLDAQVSSLESNIADLTAAKSNLNRGTDLANKSSDNASSGKGNDKSKGGSDKDKNKEEKKYRDEFDRYWDLNNIIKTVEESISDLEKEQKHLHGKELINSLQQENELLEKQKQAYENLLAEQEKERAELQTILEGNGVTFDPSGAISNYADATAKALAAYNAAIQKYNAGLLDDAALKIAETAYEDFKKTLDKYDKLYYDTMVQTQNKIDDIKEKELENNLKSWETSITITLDMREAERTWNQFLRNVNKDFKKTYQNLGTELSGMIKDAGTYTGSNGTISTDLQAIKDIENEIDKMRNGGSSDMFASVSEAVEKLKEYDKTLQSDAQALHDLYEDAWDTYLDGIDQFADKFSDLMDKYSQIDDELEYEGQLIELIYGDEAYKMMSKLYEGQQVNTMEQIDSIKQQKDMWYQMYQNAEEGSADQTKYYELWTQAQSDLNGKVIDYINLLKNEYQNTISDILKGLQTALTGSSLDELSTEWDRLTEKSDKYLDSVEGLYNIQTLANKINSSIASTSQLKYQQQLQDLYDREISALKEKENLTQYDIDAAEARYQIALKQIALEEAQNNKNSMKLTRGNDGNWSYQYVADEQDVFTKQQELTDAYNKLYQLANDAYTKNLESLKQLQEDYLTSLQEIYENENLSEEEKQERILELRNYYFEQYALLAEENTLYRNDLAESSAALLLSLYDQDASNYEAMTETEKALVDALRDNNIDNFMAIQDAVSANLDGIKDKSYEVMSKDNPYWTSGAQAIADAWNGDSDSVKTNVNDAIKSASDAAVSYQKKLDAIASAIGQDFNNITGMIAKTEQKTYDLEGATEELVDTATSQLGAYQNAVAEIEAAWRSVESQIYSAINALQQYYSLLGISTSVSKPSSSSTPADNGGGNGGGSTPTPTTGDGSPNVGDTVTFKGSYYYDSNGTSPSGSKYSGIEDGVVIDKVNSNGYGIHIHSADGQYKDLGWVSKDQLEGYATGGYTGDWNSGDGKLALLHSKELVLNQSDTSNILSAVSAIRQISGLTDSINDSIMQGISRMILDMAGIRANANYSTNESSVGESNSFIINAEFPNANDAVAIREAIESLPNLASQYASRNKK